MGTRSLRSDTEHENSVLFSLPTEIVHNILSGWIDLSSVAKLDTAVCQHSFRALYLALLSSDQFYVPSLCEMRSHISDPNTKRLRWLLARNVKVRQIEFAHGRQINVISSYLKKFGEYVQGVKHSMESHPMCWSVGPFGEDMDSQGRIVATFCKNLSSYYCSDMGVCDENFVRVLSSNPGLQELRIEGNYIAPGNVSSTTQVKLPNLRQLVIYTKYGFNEVLTALARVAPNLEKLQIACHPCKCSELPRGLIVEVGRQCPKLRSFSSRELDLGPNDVDLTPFLQTCPNVVNLDLRWHDQLTDDMLIAAFSCLKELRAINLCFCTKLTDRALSFFAERFAHTLQVLHLGENDGMTQGAIEMLKSKCTQLRTCHYMYRCKGEPLDADKLKKTTIFKVVDLHIDVDIPVFIEQAQQLQVLDLSESEGEILSAEELVDIARGCPNLQTVVVYEYRPVDYSAVKKAFPKLLFTTDKVRADFDVLSMPV